MSWACFKIQASSPADSTLTSDIWEKPQRALPCDQAFAVEQNKYACPEWSRHRHSAGKPSKSAQALGVTPEPPAPIVPPAALLAPAVPPTAAAALLPPAGEGCWRVPPTLDMPPEAAPEALPPMPMPALAPAVVPATLSVLVPAAPTLPLLAPDSLDMP